MIVIGKPVADYVAAKIGNSKWEDEQAIGIEKDGKIIAGVVIDGYVKDARCSIHCAGEGKRWLNREFLFVVFDYVFRQLNCKVVVNPVDSKNKDSLRFTEHLGFVKQAQIKDGCGDSDLVIFALHRDKCRYLGVRYGKR